MNASSSHARRMAPFGLLDETAKLLGVNVSPALHYTALVLGSVAHTR